MTKHEKLQEQYEDALFALLMEEFAAEEGKSALEENERLKRDPAFDVPPDVRQRRLKTIAKTCTKQSLRRTGKSFCKVFTKVAVVATLCMLLFTTAIAVSPTLRANTFNWIISTFEDRTELRLENSTNDSGPDHVTAGWLPDGYQLIEAENNAFQIRNVYKDQSGNSVFVNVLRNSSTVVGIDTEQADVETVNINGQLTMIIQKDNISQIVWANEILGYQVVVRSEDLPSDTLMKIAEKLSIS